MAHIITAADAATLNAARDILDALEENCKKEDTFQHGKVSEAADHAGTAIFNVLNCAHAYLDSQIAGDAIDERQTRLRGAREAASEPANV